MSTYRELQSSFVPQEESFKLLSSAEPERRKLLTPDGLFFEQNHGNAPTVDVENYQLTVTGLVMKELSLSFWDIQEEFPRVDVTATLQGFDALGNEGEKKASGTAKFAGIRLRHVLLAAGINPQTYYVAFSGLDDVQRDEKGNNLLGLLPIQKAMSPEVILAYEMNGVLLPLEQGFPLRIIVPGNDQTMNVKWINEIRLISQG